MLKKHQIGIDDKTNRNMIEWQVQQMTNLNMFRVRIVARRSLTHSSARTETWQESTEKCVKDEWRRALTDKKCSKF